MGEKTTVAGRVEGLNEKGIKVSGRWFNYSQFRQVDPPAKGQMVHLELDGDFIDSLTVRTTAPAQRAPAKTGAVRQNGSGYQPAGPPLDRENPPMGDTGLGLLPRSGRLPATRRAPESAARTNGNEDGRWAAADRRDKVITRLAVLRDAVAHLTGVNDATVEDVLALAEQFEAWANR